jgi:hypothetical protein
MPEELISSFLIAFVSFLDDLRTYGELLLVLATVCLVVVTFFLWRSTSRAAKIAEATHLLATTLAELEVQPALRVEVEERARPLSQDAATAEYMHRAKGALNRFRNLKVENVGRGPAKIQRVLYGNKEDHSAAASGKCLLVQPGLFARFELVGLCDLFRGDEAVSCRIEYSDCGNPPKPHVYRFRLGLPGETAEDLLVVPEESA